MRTSDHLHENIQSVVFQIQYSSVGGSVWYELQDSNTTNFSSYGKVAGKFNVRAIVTDISGGEYTTGTHRMDINFPTASQLWGVIQSDAGSAWDETKELTDTEGWAEVGFRIRLNTATKEYSVTNKVENKVEYSVTANASIGGNYDSPSSPSPIDTVDYNVGGFHTHPPHTDYPDASLVRPIGCSDGDKLWTVPLLLYDYPSNATGSSGKPAINKSHNRDASPEEHVCGTEQRTTP